MKKALLLSAFLMGVTFAHADGLSRCVIDGKVIFRDGLCPGAVDEKAKKQWDGRTKEKEQEAKKAATENSVQDKPNNRFGSKASVNGDVVDCYALRKYAEARGHGFFERAAIVKEAEENGRCKW